jgi:hypothetical protein
MFIKPLRISRAKSGEKERILAKNCVFLREIGPLWRKRFFRPLDFPKKTRRKPVERIRETRENREKTSIGDTCEIGRFPLKSSLATTTNHGPLTAETRRIEKKFGKKYSRKNVIFSKKTGVRARGDYENPRKQPANVLEKVANRENRRDIPPFSLDAENAKKARLGKRIP